MNYLLCLAFLILPPTHDLLRAIRIVESNDNPAAVGDGGKAFGCYQIWRVYWIDSGIPGTHQDCFNRAYSERVVLAYWERYATRKRLGREPTLEDLARIHNGGPNGFKKEATLEFWEKIQQVLQEQPH